MSQRKIKGIRFSGNLRSQNDRWTDAKSNIAEETVDFYLARMNGRSALSTQNVQVLGGATYYKAKFRQGADLMPRRLFFIDCETSNKVVIAKSNSRVDAKPPYNKIEMHDLVNSKFIFKTAISQNILPFGLIEPFTVHLPVLKDGDEWRIISPFEMIALGYSESADWFEKCDAIYSKLAKTGTGELYESLNYNNKLLVQNPEEKNIVLFNSAGSNLAATMVFNDSIFWADQRTYWYVPVDESEGRYLVAILNAPSLDSLIKPFQSVGLAGERDIHKKALEVIPKYNSSNPDMVSLAEVSKVAEKKVGQFIRENEKKHITAMRKKVRILIKDELEKIDLLAKKILSL